MATPRVFISSTCYDLGEIRDRLLSFCQSFGFETALSERGDIFFHPDLHTHESCVTETSNCHLFILIIGGRFGGKYKVDKSKSVTNAEFSAAKEAGLPVFTFIKHDVLADHNVWQKNKDQPFAAQIEYPSIEKQEFASDIFEFIDTVRLASVNNGFFGFRYAREVEDALRKQWAGMLFDFLQKRSLSQQLSITNSAVSSLSIASAKIEELVKGIYRNIGVEGADEAIAELDREAKAEEFLSYIANRLQDEQFVLFESINEAIDRYASDWWSFLIDTGFFELVDVRRPDGREVKLLQYTIGDVSVGVISEERTKLEAREYALLQEAYRNFRELPKDAKTKLLRKYSYRSAAMPTPSSN